MQQIEGLMLIKVLPAGADESHLATLQHDCSPHPHQSDQATVGQGEDHDCAVAAAGLMFMMVLPDMS